MATVQEVTSTDVFRDILAHLAKRYPAYNFETLLPSLVIARVISTHENNVVLTEKTPEKGSVRLFHEFLPLKSPENIKKCFDVLRCNFENEVSFLHGQQNILEGQWIKRIEQNLANTTAAFHERLESQAKTESQSGIHNEAVKSLMGILEDIKQDQTRMAVSIEQLRSNLVVDNSTTDKQNTLERQLIKQIGKTFADATADFYQRWESEVEVKRQRGISSKTLNDSIGKLTDLQKGLMHTVYPNDLTITQDCSADDPTEIPATKTKNAEPDVFGVPRSLANTKTIDKVVWRVVRFRKRLQKEIDAMKRCSTSIGIIIDWDTSTSVMIDSITGRAGFMDNIICRISSIHPNNALLRFWVSPKNVHPPIFRKEEYLREIGIMECDVVLIISDGKFTKRLWIARLLKKIGRLYFVRQLDSRFEMSVEAVQVKDEVRLELGDLNAYGKVFLTDSYRQNLYDFDLLLKWLIAGFNSDIRRQTAFILSLDIICEEVIKKKKEIFRKALEDLLSIAETDQCKANLIVLITVPNPNVSIDGALILAANSFFFEQFGLDDDSLERMAKIWKCDVSVLNEVVSKAKNDYLTLEGINAFVQSLSVRELLGSLTDEHRSEFLEFERLLESITWDRSHPLPTVWLHLSATLFALHRKVIGCFIDSLAEVAVQVIKTASSTSTLNGSHSI